MEDQEKLPQNTYRSVREFLLEIYKTSSTALKTGVVALIVLALPVAVYLTSSSQPPLRRSHASTPPPTQTASPSATPRHVR